MNRTVHRRALLPLAAGILLAGCASGGSGDPTPPAPWSDESLPPTGAQAVVFEEWSKADNRSRCAPLAPADLGGIDPSDATARPAQFGGGWGVAWDLPGERSAFGVAGTGVSGGEDTYEEWPRGMTWEDGSMAGYGPEGGTGPNQLAYLRIPGQDCLYNVWSRLGIEHLEDLLRDLRFVER